jgi:hypothetical protein
MKTSGLFELEGIVGAPALSEICQTPSVRQGELPFDG